MRIFLSHHLQSGVTPQFFSLRWSYRARDAGSNVAQFPLPRFESNFVEISAIPRLKGTVYFTPGIHLQSLFNVCFFGVIAVSTLKPTWNFCLFVFQCLVCCSFPPHHLLLFSFLLFLLGNYFTESKSFSSTGYFKTAARLFKKHQM